MAVVKIQKFPGVRLVADETLEAHGTEQALRAAQYELDLKLHDLRTEFLARENALRQNFLAKVAEIAAS